MALKNEITAAIAAHGIWKRKLDSAIAAGSSEFSVNKVQADNQCDFGKFLYDKLEPAKRSTENYRKCRELHSQFHKSAAHVLQLALAGKKEEAKKAMAISSEFSKVSASLTAAMMNWQASGD